MKNWIGFVLAASLVSATAFAEDPSATGDAAAPTQRTDTEFGVSVTIPAGWEASGETDRAVFEIKHVESHSQIEVIGTALMTPDVSEVFFNTFHETLAGSDFVRTGTEQKSYAPYSGTETIYQFRHSGATLKVAVFQFVRDTTAWLVVGYMSEADFDSKISAYRAVISSLQFN